MGWIGVDLDSTLAFYQSGDINKYGIEHIGAPIPDMVDRVNRWLADGKQVKIFTARAAHTNIEERNLIFIAIQKWCAKHLGVELPITATKDFRCIEIWDDRCVQVVPNTGKRVGAMDPHPLPNEKAING